MRAVLFDLDGTLVDSRADLAAAVNRTRQDWGLAELPLETVTGFVGEGIRLLVKRALAECPQNLDAAVAQTSAHYREHLLDRTVLYPGVSDALRRIGGSGWKRAVVTNKPREFVLPILRGLGIADAFDVVVGGGDAIALKPDPAPLLLAARQLGIERLCDSWVAGDHFTDLEAGRRAGARRCYCRYGFGDPREEPFDLSVDSLRELATHLQDMEQ
jgi:phosphoglycolate phosphatase